MGGLQNPREEAEGACALDESVAFGLTIAVFAATYLGLALGKIPGLRTDRAGIALAGAAAVLGCTLLSFENAVKAIDFDTIALLLGMMVVVAFLRRAGFFELLAARALSRCRNPSMLLAVVMLLSGVLSALLVNDVVCLALTPLVLHLAARMRLDPKPHLIGLAVASNVGSVATLTGNPQNMIIGGLSQIGYLRFAARLAPVAILGLLAAYAITWLMYRKTLRACVAPEDRCDESVPTPPKADRGLLVKSLLVTFGAVALFFAGAPMAVVALGGAAILLLGRVEPEEIYRQIDWSLLVLFAALFVVVRAFETHVLARVGVEHWTVLLQHPVTLLSGVSAVLSNLVSNVPAVLLFKPVIPAMAEELRETAWLALAMSSTLAGNLTILGSVANLIVVENARKEGVAISLGEYCRVGVPVTVVTLLIGMAWLLVAY
jgi:Na+/H+ antiporter NhaD/arsenite permease-like protein